MQTLNIDEFWWDCLYGQTKNFSVFLIYLLYPRRLCIFYFLVGWLVGGCLVGYICTICFISCVLLRLKPLSGNREANEPTRFFRKDDSVINNDCEHT